MRTSHGVELADIFRQHGVAYRSAHALPLNYLRVMRAVEVCRTAVLGGHKDSCDRCGHIEISYNSCRNRHCPKCQTLQKEKWIEARNEDLLPIQYFHVVFTIPSELNPLVIMNQKVMYDLMFRSVSETLIELSGNPRHLGARIGFMGVLHTWGQNLMDHPHIHCVVTGGGLSSDGTRWVSCRKKFFIPVRVMSALFRGKFLSYLKSTFESGDLIFPGGIAHLKESHIFERFRKQLYHKKWVVYCKPPFDGAKGVLQYLGRYTHRIAISNNRILTADNGTVTFRWRDYADGNKQKTMTLKVDEFIRRYLLHVLPDRYVRIRHFGLLANRSRKDNITLCRELLGTPAVIEPHKEKKETWQEQLLRICGIDVTVCPVCRTGRMS
ncbi:MAG TPA: IS91 family transposase, partial [Thermodesulfovibrionales bacterium]|nr:IS91 family transposase [Thermodesulfovibrionales bacterium]